MKSLLRSEKKAPKEILEEAVRGGGEGVKEKNVAVDMKNE